MTIAAYQKATKLKIGFVLSTGNGDVYTLEDYPSRLIKIVKWDHVSRNLGTIDQVVKLLTYLSKSKNTAIAKIYKHGTFTLKGNKYFYYVMERLNLYNSANDVMYDLYLDNKGKSVKEKKFIQAVKKLKYRYKDCHGGNCMQDAMGNLKLIDLESFLWKEASWS